MTQHHESVWSLAVFWLVAFTSAAIFAAVLLAPHWEEKELLTQRVQALGAQCQYLGDMNRYLGHVVHAIEHDPDFTGELARSELDYGQPGEERLAAPSCHWERPRPPAPLARRAASWDPILLLFARDRVVRAMAMATAAVFAVVGLALFRTSEPVATEDDEKGSVVQ